ncbi:MAG: terpene cyclase/mutase family protein [Candidatus Kerfeldbacteria bacterium]|nr:terpene cyclase/mutase family protein [Candidatus Kerfeldbacteria bacterium]
MNTRTVLPSILTVVMLCIGAQAAHAASYAGVNVRIETSSDTVYNSTVYITDDGCTVIDSAEEEHALTGFNAMCALDAAAQDGGFEYSFDASEYGFFITAIGEYTNAIDYSEYWGSYLNLESMTASLDYTEVQDGDEVLLTFGGYADISPLRLTLDKNHVVEGNPIVAKVEYFVVTDWLTNEGEYFPVENADVTIGRSIKHTNVDGEVEFTFNTPGEYTAEAVADGFTRSVNATLTVYAEYPEILSFFSTSSIEDQVRSGAEYLVHHTVDGKVGESRATTEWAVQAIAQARALYGNDVIDDTTFQSMVDRVVAYHPKASQTNAASEISRHILALVSLGLDPRNSDGIDFVRRLKNTMSDRQFGDASLCNDDIFAGLALVAAGEKFSSKPLRRAMKASLTCQNEDGGFGYGVNSTSDVDTTAAWLMLAGEFKGHKAKHQIELTDPRKSAFNFMKRGQHPDGGWGYSLDAASNSSTTAWAVIGYDAHDITADQRVKNNQSGIDFITGLQGNKGGVQYNEEKDASNIALNTAYAMMAWMGTQLGQ